MDNLLSWKRKIKIAFLVALSFLFIKAGIQIFPFGDIAFITLPYLQNSILALLAFIWIEITIYCAVLIHTDLIRQNRINIALRIGKRKTNILYAISLLEGIILYETILLLFAGQSFWLNSILDGCILFFIFITIARKNLSLCVETMSFIAFLLLILISHTFILN